MSNTTSVNDVTQGELVTNVRYGYWFNHFCERLYARLDITLNFVQLVGGSTAAFAAMQEQPQWAAAAGVGLAVAAAISLLVQPAIKAERHRRAKCDYLALDARAWKLTFDALTDELAKVRMDSPTGIDALAVPAYNATLRAIGSSATPMEESPIHRLAKALA